MSQTIEKKPLKSYFKQERGTQQGDPILVYLYTLVLEIALTLIKTNNNIEDLNIFNHNFLCTVYTDYTTLFIKNINCAIKIKTFFSFSGFTFNNAKCEITERSKTGTLWL